MEIKVWPPETLAWNGNRVRCAIGRSGVTADKKEGDGATPAGTFPLRRVLYRPDRLNVPETRLPLRALEAADGWCDAPESPDYNRLVRLPFAGSHETLWRDDGVYDVIVELGYNDDPVVPGLGSAIFMHIARPGFDATEGCVALRLEDLLEVLSQADETTVLSVSLQPHPEA